MHKRTKGRVQEADVTHARSTFVCRWINDQWTCTGGGGGKVREAMSGLACGKGQEGR